jgi:hypothetical protein
LEILVRNAAVLIAIYICIGGASMMVFVGASLLRNVRDEVVGLLAELPTRAVEDTAAGREANRGKARAELIQLLLIRSAPGALVATCGLVLLAILSIRLLGLAATCQR